MKKKILAVALGLTLCFGMTGCTNVVNIDKTIKSPNSKLCDFEVVETNFYGAILVDKNTNLLKVYRENAKDIENRYSRVNALRRPSLGDVNSDE